MSRRRPGTCREPGPGPAHCTDEAGAGHPYSCYDAGEDVSWNDRFPEDWQTETPHDCEDPECPDRRTPESLRAPAPPCLQCGPGYRIGDEGCRHSATERQTWEYRRAATDLALHFEVDDQGRVRVHESVLARVLHEAGWERTA